MVNTEITVKVRMEAVLDIYIFYISHDMSYKARCLLLEWQLTKAPHCAPFKALPRFVINKINQQPAISIKMTASIWVSDEILSFCICSQWYLTGESHLIQLLGWLLRLGCISFPHWRQNTARHYTKYNRKPVNNVLNGMFSVSEVSLDASTLCSFTL